MAHNTNLSAAVGDGDDIVTVDLALATYPTGSNKLPASCLYVSANTTTAPTPVTATNALYVQPGTSTTWPISAASLPLPSGAATAAKQPALGTAGAASADVITVQGIASGVAITVSANAGTNLNTSALALETTATSIKTAVELIDNAISGSEMQVDVVASLPAGDNNIGNVDIVSLPALATGSNVIGAVTQSGTWTVQPGNTANTTAWLVEERAGTAGGLTLSKTISAATTNSTNVKGSAGKVYHIFASNINAAVRYLKLYNKATAPTVGTDTPVLTYAIPGNTAGAGFTINVPTGLEFTTGIGFGLTTGVADANTGAVAADEIVVNLGYK